MSVCLINITSESDLEELIRGVWLAQLQHVTPYQGRELNTHVGCGACFIKEVCFHRSIGKRGLVLRLVKIMSHFRGNPISMIGSPLEIRCSDPEPFASSLAPQSVPPCNACS